MSLISYWPKDHDIEKCIRTEAEELSEPTLLAVHEPMHLVKKTNTGSEQCTESDLLKHFLEVERPIPIIGRSGVGKSHLIRWLEAQIKLREESSRWHIVRIPKNASLRQVLELLLDGLEGEEFEQARKKITTVGTGLKTEEVARHLLTFMEDLLLQLSKDVQAEIEQYQSNNTKPGPEEAARLRDIKRHTSNPGLQSLINDSEYKKYLLSPEHCIFQFASRLTTGASDDEIFRNNYRIEAKDLDFTYNLSDLSRGAREYVRNSRLNTSEDSRVSAAKVLNEVLGEATRRAFQHFFHFSGGSFQDLFKDIRRSLNGSGQTLVVLVEDMAAISAIEDVLLDSLLEEGVRDGESTLCPLRSAIAVTDGYPGYSRRQGTIYTRARAEWLIQESIGTEEQIYTRIIDFCSRYLNAARHGAEDLLSSWSCRSAESWPEIWQDPEADRQHLDAFGVSRNGVPLYPFSSAAIRALADKFCRDVDGNLQFNPREVLNEILRKVLRGYRSICEKGEFPPPGFAGLQPSGTLRGEIHRLGLSDPGRAETLAAIWGFNSRNFSELQKILSADVASEFALNDFAKHLIEGVIPSTNPDPSPVPPTEPTPGRVVNQKPAEHPGPSSELERLELVVDEWLQGKQDLGQNEAKVIRNGLAAMYERYAKNSWLGVRELPSLKQKNTGRVAVNIPNAQGNLPISQVSFFGEDDLKDDAKSISVYHTALALLRYEHFNSKGDPGIKGWRYEGGYNDFIYYQNFAATWVPYVEKVLVDNVRLKVGEKLKSHIESALALGYFSESDNNKQKIRKLIDSSETIRDSLPAAACEAIERLRHGVLADWDMLRSAWLDLIASNDHGLEGDIALRVLRGSGSIELSRNIRQQKEQALKELGEVSQKLELLSDCKGSEDFSLVIEELMNLVRDLQKQGEYPKTDQIPTSKTLIGKLGGLLESGHWKPVRELLAIYENDDPVKQLKILNYLDGAALKRVSHVLEVWQQLYSMVLPRLQNKNEAWGASKLEQANERIDELIAGLELDVCMVRGNSDVNS
ncbi:protein DpdH [Marinobacter adhaerens]|uniref:protein DpdH n=1 Tax=Marinobacter adhaerens TaxID=1033846 RepID=UPI001C599C71|nr:protein DpdH [Marinobacter adhaerens]MBW3225282.1 hypothetical protein [Marinobacter adhaerens]